MTDATPPQARVDAVQLLQTWMTVNGDAHWDRLRTAMQTVLAQLAEQDGAIFNEQAEHEATKLRLGVLQESVDGCAQRAKALTAERDALKAALKAIAEQDARLSSLKAEHDEVLGILKPGGLLKPNTDGSWTEIPTTLIERARMVVCCLDAEADAATEFGKELRELRVERDALKADIQLFRDKWLNLPETAR